MLRVLGLDMSQPGGSVAGTSSETTNPVKQADAPEDVAEMPDILPADNAPKIADVIQSEIDRTPPDSAGKGVQVAQLALPGMPFLPPTASDVSPGAVPPNVERDIKGGLDRASRRMGHIADEAAHGKLSDALGHALLGQPFPPEVDAPADALPPPLPTHPGTTPLADGQRGLLGQPETPTASSEIIGDREGLEPPAPRSPTTTAHPMPDQPGPHIAAATGLGKMDLPRTPGLGAKASMADLVAQDAIPGFQGVELTDKVESPEVLFPDMHRLSEAIGAEYALTRRKDGTLVLSSGAPNVVRTRPGSQPIAHTHPGDEPLPSVKDIQVLNDLWKEDPSMPRPTSAIVWGSAPGDVTPYGATGTDNLTSNKQGVIR